METMSTISGTTNDLTNHYLTGNGTLILSPINFAPITRKLRAL